MSKIKSGILYRTTNTNCPRYPLYGGSGVKLCAEWENFEVFVNDLKNLKGYNEDEFLDGKLALDKDIKGDSKLYSRETCSWCTLEDNNRVKPNQQKYFTVYDTKTRKYLGVFRNQSEVARILDVYPATISSALRLRGYYKQYLLKWIDCR